jgi:Fe-S cluster biogenesis protein NfuA
MDLQAVNDAIAELAPILQADGADLVLVEADAATSRIEVRLEVTDATCAECVLPGPLLEQVICDAIARRVPTEFELVLRDPRVAGANGH